MIVGVGCDIVEIKRMQIFLENKKKLVFLSQREKELCKNYPLERKAEWLAGRFAAKEAIFKAIHTQFQCTIFDFEILANEDGSPVCHIDGYTIHISISHEKEYAIAYALVEK